MQCPCLGDRVVWLYCLRYPKSFVHSRFIKVDNGWHRGFLNAENMTVEQAVPGEHD